MARNLHPFRRGRQTGAAMVEAAIALPIFFALLFAIIEFALALFDMTRVVDATREGVRWAIVNDPECDIFDTGTGCPGNSPLSCPGGSPLVIDCGGRCAGLVGRMQLLLPQLQDTNVRITYACGETGVGLRPRDPNITVEVTGMSHNFILPGLLGIDATLPLPTFPITRTGEDLDTV